MYNAGILNISLKLIEEALHFPEGHVIEGIQFDLEQRYARGVKLLITGPTLPSVMEGTQIPWIEGIVETQPDGTKKVRFK